MAQVLQVDPLEPDPERIRLAAETLRRGGLVAFPTETVYGLGADAHNAQAVELLFKAKGRPANDPIIVHVLDIDQLTAVAATIPPLALELADSFWPGPLTLVVPRGPLIPPVTTAGLDSVGVRSPSHPVSRALLAAFGAPIAAPSANTFGRTSPTTAGHVLSDLGEAIDLVLDAGPTPVGVESTVVDVRSSPAIVLRPGGVAFERLAAIVPELCLAKIGTSAGAQPSPGRLARHYAPDAPLILISGADPDIRAAMLEICAALGGMRVGLLVSDEDTRSLASVGHEMEIRALGSLADMSTVAQRLYSALRDLDEAAVDLILARDFGSEGLALAVHDRLTRAADGHVFEVVPDGAAAAARRAAEVIRKAGT